MDNLESMELVLTEIRELRRDFKDDINALRQKIDANNVPSNKELGDGIASIEDKVKGLDVSVSELMGFKTGIIAFGSMIVFVGTVINHNYEVLLRWFHTII